MILKYLAYYRNLYYNSDIVLEKSELWLVVILSKSLSELYDLLSELLSKEKRDKFIRKVIEMSTDAFILSEWEREKLDELEELARLEDAREEGIQENQKEVILNMFNDNVSLDVISKYTKLTKEEIEDIINNFNNNKNK